MRKQQIKNGIIALSIIGIILIICLASTLFTGYTPSNTFSFDDSNMNLIKTESIQPTAENTLTISTGYSDVILEESKTEEFVIEEYCNKELAADKQFSVTASEDNILIKSNSDKLNSFDFFSFHKYKILKIYIPASFTNHLNIETKSGEVISNIDLEMESIIITTSSGDINAQNLTGDQITLGATSGEIYANTIVDSSQNKDLKNNENTNKSVNITIETSSGDIQVEEIWGNTNLSATSGMITVDSILGDSKIKTSSGDIQLGSIQGDLRLSASSGEVFISDFTGNGDFSTNSGDMQIDNMQGKLRLSSSSGKISVLDFTGNGDFSTTSGDINIIFQEITGDVLINASSGEVNCSIPEDAAFEFLANTSSGEITTSFDDDLLFGKKGKNANGSVGNNPTNTMDITTTSGDITLWH